MARVVRFHQLGGPEVLCIEDMPVSDPGAGELHVRIEVIGLNRAEAMFRAGKYLEQPLLPSRIGYEASAVVEAVGKGVTGFKPGDKVSILPGFSMTKYGVYGEQAIVPASAVIQRPTGIGAVEAAAVWMAYLTAYGALNDIGKMGRGDSVIITAASSSVGLAAIQLANSVGARPIAVTRGSSKKADLLKAGAVHVIATEEQDLVAEVMLVTDSKGARLVFDPIAGPITETLAQAMARDGILFVYGDLSGQAGQTLFPFSTAIMKGLSMRAYTVFEILHDPRRREAAAAAVIDGLQSGKLKPIIAKTFPLDRIVEAHRYLESNQQFGKVVVTVP